LWDSPKDVEEAARSAYSVSAIDPGVTVTDMVYHEVTEGKRRYKSTRVCSFSQRWDSPKDVDEAARSAYSVSAIDPRVTVTDMVYHEVTEGKRRYKSTQS